jgi:hypothetical protein
MEATEGRRRRYSAGALQVLALGWVGWVDDGMGGWVDERERECVVYWYSIQ